MPDVASREVLARVALTGAVDGTVVISVARSHQVRMLAWKTVVAQRAFLLPVVSLHQRAAVTRDSRGMHAIKGVNPHSHLYGNWVGSA
eukprot:scaffold145_cov261-Pinguiococcus_pyrenoidosus.AAC.24